MRTIILGASRFGSALAEELIEANHEVVLIDRDRDRLDALSDRMDCGMVEGDGTLPSVLRDAFRNEDDVFVAVTNASDDNILACLVARSVGFGRVIPQITSSEFMDVCEELELADAINPHATVAESIRHSIEDKTEVDAEGVLHDELALKRVMVPDQMAGSSLSDITLPDGCRAIALIRDESESFVEAETKLRANDCLLFAVDRSCSDDLAKAFEA